MSEYTPTNIVGVLLVEFTYIDSVVDVPLAAAIKGNASAIPAEFVSKVVCVEVFPNKCP